MQARRLSLEGNNRIGRELIIEFETDEELRREFDANLSAGGLSLSSNQSRSA